MGYRKFDVVKIAAKRQLAVRIAIMEISREFPWPADIAHILRTDRRRLHPHITWLLKHGYLEKGETDGRAYKVKLTKRGRETLHNLT